jgi:hydrogenase maturation protease
VKTPTILVAGVGNVFLGDDGFGVETARRLQGRPLPEGVRVAEFGIRGFDLACALADSPDLLVLVDVVRRGDRPGTLYVLEAEEQGGAVDFQGHGMNPAQVLRNARVLGGRPVRVLVVGCEPAEFGDPGVGHVGLSPAVEAAVEPAIALVLEQIRAAREERTAHA